MNAKGFALIFLIAIMLFGCTIYEPDEVKSEVDDDTDMDDDTNDNNADDDLDDDDSDDDLDDDLDDDTDDDTDDDVDDIENQEGLFSYSPELGEVSLLFGFIDYNIQGFAVGSISSTELLAFLPIICVERAEESECTPVESFEEPVVLYLEESMKNGFIVKMELPGYDQMAYVWWDNPPHMSFYCLNSGPNGILIEVSNECYGTDDAPILYVEAEAIQASQYVAGTTGNIMMNYRLTALNEDVEVLQFYVATSGVTASVDVNRIKIYFNDVQLGIPSGYILNVNGVVQIVLPPDAMVIFQDTTANLTIKVDFIDKTRLTDGAMLAIGFGDSDGDDSEWGTDGTYADGSYEMIAVGKQSGMAVNPANINNMGDDTGQVAGSRINYLYDGVLVVSLNSSTPSGAATAGPDHDVLRLNLTAVGDDITVDDIEFIRQGTCLPTGTGTTSLKSGDSDTTYATWPVGIAWLNETGFHVADNGVKSAGGWDNPLMIAAGQTKVVKLIGDTTGCNINQTLMLGVNGSLNTISGVVWRNVFGEPVDSLLTRILPIYGGVLVY